MHPAVLAVLVVGGIIVVYGGIEVGRRMYEDHEERRRYEEYVRRHNRDFEKSRGLSDDNSGSSDDDDDDDDNTDIRKLNMMYRDHDNLRHRRTGTSRQTGSSSMASLKSNSRRSYEEHESNLYHSAYELTEMEKDILDRRQRLQMEQARLDEEERDLERRRELLARRGNSINGLGVTNTTITDINNDNDVNNNPFFRPPIVQEHAHPNFDESVAPSFFFASQQPSPSPSPTPTTQQRQEMTERSIIYDYEHHPSSSQLSSSDESDASSASLSSRPSMYQSTGGLEASTAELGPRIDAIQAPNELLHHTDTDWSDVVSSVSGNRSRAVGEDTDGLSDEFSQLSVHSSNRGGRTTSVSGESSVSYDMLSFTDLDGSRSQRL
ncbi:hypothetical protein BDC45DRAFT_607505 [Circinella umbellata]|nr:hypothetical protein BDC45DRAFT_607505 [Circinella umbellata]